MNNFVYSPIYTQGQISNLFIAQSLNNASTFTACHFKYNLFSLYRTRLRTDDAQSF